MTDGIIPDLFDRVQRVTPGHLMEATLPGDDPTWVANHAYIESEHHAYNPEYWDAFLESVRSRGIRRPVIVHAGKVTNGHHRVWAAARTGRDVPVVVRSTYRQS